MLRLDVDDFPNELEDLCLVHGRLGVGEEGDEEVGVGVGLPHEEVRHAPNYERRQGDDGLEHEKWRETSYGRVHPSSPALTP